MLFLVILLCTAPRVQGYPSGAGSGACFSELQPGHSDIPSQTISTSPYSINSGVGIYKAGDNISVTLEAAGSALFSGFYVGAYCVDDIKFENPKGKMVAVGDTITPPDFVQPRCGNTEHFGATHTWTFNQNKQSVVNLFWNSPEGHGCDVVFVMTAVQQYNTFWARVKTAPIRYSTGHC